LVPIKKMQHINENQKKLDFKGASLVKIPQENIAVTVDYYSDEERDKLLDYSSREGIKEVIKTGVKIPTAEFLTYYLFHRKRPGKPGYRRYSELGDKIWRSLIDLEDWVKFNGTSIYTAEDVEKQDTGITERIGESVGLSVINRIHGLTEADWDKIPEKSGKGAYPVFDYKEKGSNLTASKGETFIQVETKGSMAEDNREKTDAIRTHKSNIKDKKKKIKILEQEDRYPFKANLRYGIITVMDNRKNGTLRSLLVDPDSNELKITPSKLQLLNRMRFLYELICFISPRSQLSSSLATRTSSLSILEDPYMLNKLPLRKGNGEEFKFEPSDVVKGQLCSFFLNKSRIIDEPVGGAILKLSNKFLFFFGIWEELVIQAAEQNFEEILKFKTTPVSRIKMIECIVSEAQFEKFDIPEGLIDSQKKGDRYRVFRLKGQLHYSKEGIVFGILPITPDMDTFS